MLSDLVTICEKEDRQLEINIFAGHCHISVSYPKQPFNNDVLISGFKSADNIAALVLQSLIREAV